MIFKGVITKHFLMIGMGALLVACGSNPTQDMNPGEIGQYLGYSQVAPVSDIPTPATFNLEGVNSRTAVMTTRFSRNYLIVFSHSCPEAGFGGQMKTTATGGRMDAEDSIIINETYCRISEIYFLQ